MATVRSASIRWWHSIASASRVNSSTTCSSLVVPVGGLIELKVDRPHVIGRLGAESVSRDRRDAKPLALSAPLRHPESFLAPQPLRPLAVQLPSLVEQQLMRTTVAPPRPTTGDPTQLRPQRLIVANHDRLVTLGRAVLPDIAARPPLRDTKAVLDHQDRPAPARRAHQFPRLTSRSAAISSV